VRLELKGFAPDIDSATPGILVDCDAIVPTLKGMAAANTPVDAGFPALSEPPTSAYVAELLDGTKRTFAGTAATIQEATGGNWVDRSRAGGYSGNNRMRFCEFGNVVLATNRAEVIQKAGPGDDFEDIDDAPLALILVSANGFVLALNINGMTLGDVADGWGCSAIRNHEDWTPSAATQCVAGRLLDSPGPITAGAALGDLVVAYKGTSMYLGQYVGPPIVWSWTRIAGDIGCAGAEALVALETEHFFIGPDDIYRFDGTVPRAIGAPIREWFFANLSAGQRHNIVGTVDRARSLVYWYYPSVNSQDGELDSCLVYNYKTDKWGKWSISIQAAVQYSSGQITYDELGDLYATYDDLPNISYDSPFWLADQTVPGVFIGDSLMSLTGEPGQSFMVTGDFGDLTDFAYVDRVTPRYTRKPASAQLTNFYRLELGESLVTDATAPFQRGRFDMRRSARWHRFRIVQQGAAVINGLDVAIDGDSAE